MTVEQVPVNRLADAEDVRTHWVYRLQDRDGVLLYVGCTHQLSARVAYHSQRLGHQLHRWTAERFPNKAEARAAEIAAIRDEHPRLNVQHQDTGVGAP